MSSTIFDVQEPTNSLAFQDFSSTRITSDVPSGRISPAGSPHVNLSSNSYSADSFTNSLSNSTKSGGILSLDYYTGYFDVDTVTVLRRCYKTLLPKEDYVAEVLAGVPDLYGPFWVPTTLIFSLFLTSSLTSSITAYLAGESYTYDFTRLGAAVTLVYAYSLGLPILVWVALKYWAKVYERSAVEITSIYGYSATIWILVSWLSLIPYTPIRLLVAFLGTTISLAFILRNLYPVLTTSPNVSARLLILLIGGIHLGMCLGLYFGFIVADGGRFNKGTSPIPISGGGSTGEGAMEALLRLL